MRVSYVEIYNEEIKDLFLKPGAAKGPPLKVMDDPKRGPYVAATPLPRHCRESGDRAPIKVKALHVWLPRCSHVAIAGASKT